MKGKLIPSNINNLCPSVSRDFHATLLVHGASGEIDLMDFVRDSIFESAVKKAYGKDNVPKEKVCRYYLVYDG